MDLQDVGGEAGEQGEGFYLISAFSRSVYPVTLLILALYCCFPLSSWATLGKGFKPLCLSFIQLVCEKPRSYRHGKRPGLHF